MSGKGMWIAWPVEVPRSCPLQFKAGAQMISAMRAWPAGHLAKCRVIYHPRDPSALRERQLARLAELQYARVDTAHELVVEIVLRPDLPRDGATLSEALEEIYEAGVFPDWWMLRARRSAGNGKRCLRPSEAMIRIAGESCCSSRKTARRRGASSGARRRSTSAKVSPSAGRYFPTSRNAGSAGRCKTPKPSP